MATTPIALWVCVLMFVRRLCDNGWDYPCLRTWSAWVVRLSYDGVKERSDFLAEYEYENELQYEFEYFPWEE